MNTRKANELAGKNYNVVLFCGGANDILAVTTLADMKTYSAAVQDYITDTLGAVCVVLVVPPRTQEAGVPLDEGMLSKLLDFNDWLSGRHNGTTRLVADYFTAMTTDGTTPNPIMFKDETGKRLHPNPNGSWAMVSSAGGLYDVTVKALGIRSKPSVTSGIIAGVGAMSGSGGTVGAQASGAIATGWSGSGLGGTNGRVFAKNPDGSQRVTINLPDGSGSAPSTALEVTTDPTTGYAVGKELYAWGDFEMHSGSFADGPWLQFRGVGLSTYTRIGLNKAGSTTGFMPLNSMGRGLIRTPNMVVQSGNTKLEYLIRAQVFASVKAASMDFTVHGAGIINLSQQRRLHMATLHIDEYSAKIPAFSRLRGRAPNTIYTLLIKPRCCDSSSRTLSLSVKMPDSLCTPALIFVLSSLSLSVYVSLGSDIKFNSMMKRQLEIPEIAPLRAAQESPRADLNPWSNT